MWQPWGPCSATCSGQRRRARTCVPPHSGGAPCRGNIVNTQHCGARQCPGISVFFLKMKYNKWPDDRRIYKKLKIASFDISRYAILKTIYSAFVLYDSKCHKIYKRNLIKIINKRLAMSYYYLWMKIPQMTFCVAFRLNNIQSSILIVCNSQSLSHEI